jgi:protein-S-isoprenylcysteine O-methyltransferase Ste14
MHPTIAKIIYFVGFWMANFVIRAPHIKTHHATAVSLNRKTPGDTSLFLAVGIGGFLIPLFYVFTPWLAFADYTIPLPVGLAGVVLLVLGDVVFWKSHRDLGRNWSPTLELREGHKLVETGIYARVRHPMYSAIWLLVIAEAMILPNYIAGLSGLIPFAILYVQRVGKEERMMLEQFGAGYERYMSRTGRLLPKFRKD